MSRPSIARELRHAITTASRTTRPQPGFYPIVPVRSLLAFPLANPFRPFTSMHRKSAGLMPHTENPRPPRKEPEVQYSQATAIEPAEYGQYADEYLDQIYDRAESVQETRKDVEVEYSQGVLTLTFPPAGTYVINKQPANFQIWLSSPISGPKRYDWVMVGEGMDHKEGGGVGDWIYLRDGSSMTDLLRQELGMTVHRHGEEAAEDALPSTDATE